MWGVGGGSSKGRPRPGAWGCWVWVSLRHPLPGPEVGRLRGRGTLGAGGRGGRGGGGQGGRDGGRLSALDSQPVGPSGSVTLREKPEVPQHSPPLQPITGHRFHLRRLYFTQFISGENSGPTGMDLHKIVTEHLVRGLRGGSKLQIRARGGSNDLGVCSPWATWGRGSQGPPGGASRRRAMRTPHGPRGRLCARPLRLSRDHLVPGTLGCGTGSRGL